MKNLILSLLIMVSACGSVKDKNKTTTNLEKENIKSKEIVVLKVNAQKVECYGTQGKQQCMQIKELGKDNYWQNQYEGIEGFDYKPGFIYNLQVEKIELKAPPQDRLSIFYKLIEVVKKEKPITDEMLSDYATLTVTKIQQGRDGFTATLTNDIGNLFQCTMSIPNLENNFVSLEIGDKVKIAGDYEGENPTNIYPKKVKFVEKVSLKYLPELTVTKVKGESDGETVHLIDSGKMTYTMVVSIPNLGDNYISLKEGDKVKVEGDYAESIPVRIYAKKIHKLNK